MAVAGRPVLLLACLGVDIAPWQEAIARDGPDLELRVWPDTGDLGEIDYVLAWNPPATVWNGLSGLRVIFSMGAGVDRLISAAGIPSHVPVVRMVDSGLVSSMVEFVMMRTLHYHRRMPEFEASQRLGIWEQLPTPLTRERRVSIMGAGQLGLACANALAGLGFDVSAWSRSQREVTGIRMFTGDEALPGLLARSDILICLLPLTAATTGILNRRLFGQLPLGASLINVGRGAHLVEDELLDALATGRIAHATLDVFREEPLPADHPFWRHPAITVLPHISALTRPVTAAATLVANLRRDWGGDTLLHEVRRSDGY